MAIPSDISGLYAWYKADSYTPIADGTQVPTDWTDSSGNGRTMTRSAAAGVYPKYYSNQIAGYPAIKFTQADQGYFTNTTFSWVANLASHTSFFVWYPITSGFSYTVFGEPTNEPVKYDAVAKQFIKSWNNTVPTGFTAVSTVTSEAWHYVQASQNGTSNIAISSDSETEISTSMSGTRSAGVTNTCRIGGDGSGYVSGYLAEAFIFSSYLSSANKQLMYDYLSGKYFNVVPGQNESVRDVISRRLWLLRRPNGLYEVTVPLWMLDADILDRISVEGRVAPDPSGEGWKAKNWQRRAFSIQRIDVDPGSFSAKLQLLDRRPLDILMWDAGMSNVSGISSSDSSRENGVARMSMGNTRTFSRASKVWVSNPSDVTSCVEVSTGRPCISYEGELFEEARTNYVTRSSFVSGTTGLTLTGTGVNGSTIATDSTDAFFNKESLAVPLKFTAGTSQTSDLRAAFAATSSLAGNSNVVVSIDHKTYNGEPLTWRLQRGVDSLYWNNDPGVLAWQATAVDNYLGANFTRTSTARYIAGPFSVGSNATTLTLSVALLTGGLGSRISWLYHAQIEVGDSPSSRIISDASAVTRAAPSLTYEVTDDQQIYNPERGTFYCEFIPNWNSSEVSDDREIYHMDGNDGYAELYWSSGSEHFTFVHGDSSATFTPSEITRGTVYKIAVRWTGSDGELDLDPYTMDVFVNGEKGNSGTASAAPTFTSPGTLYIGSYDGSDYFANGVIRNRRIYPYPLTDEEIANMEE